MNKLIMSREKRELCKRLEELGFEIIASQLVSALPSFERFHADLQCLKINDVFFVIKSCKTLIKKLEALGKKVVPTEKDLDAKYPDNVLLNAAFLDNKLYCKSSALDESVRRYYTENGIEIVNVNQGYAKCSTALFSDGFITADRGLYEAMSRGRAEGLLIEPGDIELSGVSYGFIGGCCFEHKDNLYFTGEIKTHRSYEKIKRYCERKNKKIVCLSDGKLYDIGGFIVI